METDRLVDEITAEIIGSDLQYYLLLLPSLIPGAVLKNLHLYL